MKFNEQIFQSTIESYVQSVVVDVKELKKFIEWEKFEKRIEELEVEKRKLELSTKSVAEVKEEIEKTLEEILITEKRQLHNEIELSQQNKGERKDELIGRLIRIASLENVRKSLNIMDSTDYPKGLGRHERELELAKINARIKTQREKQAEFKAKQVFGKEPYKDERDAIAMWRYIAPRFCEACSPQGGYLNTVESEEHRKLLEIYIELKLDKIPKIRLMNPIMRKGDVLDVPYPHGSPSWEIKE